MTDELQGRSSLLASLCLSLLFLVVPFEPRFTLPLSSLSLSLVEAVALPCLLVVAGIVLRRDGSIVLSRSTLALGLFFVIELLSAAAADLEPARALKFALRMGAMTLFAWLVSRLDEREVRWPLASLAVAGAVAAVLAFLEGIGVRSLDVIFGAFRESAFNVAGVRRATAGSEYPNLGAAMIVYAMIAGVVVLARAPRMRALFVLALSGGLVFTYSRGAWLAGLAGLVVIGVMTRTRGRFVPAIVLGSVIALFLMRAEISQLRLGGENANDFYAATYETPKQFAMDASARIIVPVTIKNVGRRPWRKADEIHLSYHLYQGEGRPLVDGPRTDLPRDILPGDSVTLETTLRAPARGGEYLLMWDLVHEDTTWFSGQGVHPGVARLIVGGSGSAAPVEVSEAQALKAIPEGLAWRPSRLDLWSIASRMWATNPVLGVGPDNFRWLYGTVAGKTTFDTRVFANNMYLEIAATIGTLGLMAFLAAILVSLHAGWRAASHSDAALAAFGVLVAMLVHGLADYLLAFTGHYLVFGLAVGVLARRPLNR